METAAGQPINTVALESILEQARLRPFEVFEAWPIDVVRKTCLETLRRGSHGRIGAGGMMVEHLEDLIRRLREANDNLWEDLFHWYVQYAGEGQQAIRAVEFAIALARDGRSELHEAAKAVSNKLHLHSDRLYWEASQMGSFMETLLGALEPGSDGYRPGAWQLAERAIRRIVAEEDTSFLPQIEKLAAAHEKGDLYPASSRNDPFAQVMNNALLAEALKVLRLAREAQTPDLTASVGSFLRGQAGFSDSVVIGVGVSFSRHLYANTPVELRVIIEPTRRGERNELAAMLPNLWVQLESNGSVEVLRDKTECEPARWTEVASRGGWFSTLRQFTSEASCAFTLKSCAGRRRLWLTFQSQVKGRRTNLATVVKYVTFE